MNEVKPSVKEEIAAPNAYRLLWAGFMAILAAGVGFSIRGGILGDWAQDFGFSQTQLGGITGGGLLGFGIIILISAFVADIIGYGPLMISAFVCHLISAILTLGATTAYSVGGQSLAYQCLYWGMFLFAVGNGIAEAVVNPLVATLFPKNKTHYLNILHAGWPGGLIVGGLLSSFMVGKFSWQLQMTLFLVPVAVYGLMCLGQHFPKSEASSQGVSYTDMLGELGLLGCAVIVGLLGIWFGDLMPKDYRWAGAIPAIGLLIMFGMATGFRLGYVMLAFLLVIHAMVGYVELGTDSWISNITGNILADKQKGLLLFVYTSGLMFALRFFAGPIVHKISPLGLLFASGLFAAIGLVLLGSVETLVLLVIAATIYGIGKTFFWPTMLGVVSERFPKGGAITIGAIGGVGMLSAGLLGGPGIGYKQDYVASNHLKSQSPAIYEKYQAEKENAFLFLPPLRGLDGGKVEDIRRKDIGALSADERVVRDADLLGGKTALMLTAIVPAVMAICYLILIMYFKTIGGYKAEVLVGHAANDEVFTGGVAGPVE